MEVRRVLFRSLSDGLVVVRLVRELFSGRASVKSLGGPITITRQSVTMARGGLELLFAWIAMISINIAVLNLLPIPILDGGQIVITVIESAKGSPFSMRTREYILRFGLAAIGLLFAVVIYYDLRLGRLIDAIMKGIRGGA